MEDEWGISDGYFDVSGIWHEISSDTRNRIRASMGQPQAGPPIWFTSQGSSPRLWNTCRVVLEDGTSLGELNQLPADLPIGYHNLIPVGSGPTTRLIVHPDAMLPMPLAWGVCAQLYSLWSEHSWGIGNLGDLRRLAERLVEAGGSVILTSPLHQPAPSTPQETSPYYPSSRRALNPLLVALAVPPTPSLACLPDQLIRRDDAWQAKRAALEAEYDNLSDPGDLPDLPHPVAIWNAICDVYGPNWPSWPAELSRFNRGGLIEALAADRTLARRAGFHQWCQRLVARQLSGVADTGIQLVGDLAVGFSPNGADAWQFQDCVAADMRIGAPPDPFSTDGQEWGIPPFIPWRLRNAWYEPFIETVRAAFHGVNGLRIDHVMGLFRQFWVPVGASPVDGAYVAFPWSELLAILCLEAVRADAFVIGEDLGTVEPRVRDELARRHIAGCKVLLFESEHPSQWHPHSLATVTTHDLPTIAGVLGGTDGDESHRLKLLGAATNSTEVADVVEQVHTAMLRSQARLRLLTLDDLCASPERPNHPGSITDTNWCRRLPMAVDEIPLPLVPPVRE